ncbi:MAG: MotA/TolQ/ExbB proton channel family protein [Pseudomonadota bacterium]
MILDLIDGGSALVVLGGTCVATVLRCGRGELAITLRALAALPQHRFIADHARAELAPQVRAIQQDGLLRAPVRHVGDADFDDATDALIHDRTIESLLAAHDRHKARRLADADSAVRVLAQAAELAPVFGMAGTLIALNRMARVPLDGGTAMTGAIGMAVLTTLYGILVANLVLAPLARAIERAAGAEEMERQKVMDWLAGQVEAVCPHTGRRTLKTTV